MDYQPEYVPESRPRTPGRKHARPILLVMGVVVISALSLMIATCGDTVTKAPVAATEGVMEKVGRRIQKVLGRTVTIHSNGIVAFPREVVEVVLENHDIQTTTRYESTGRLGMGKSNVVMNGTYRARVGFDLGKASAEVQDGTLRLWLPKPRVLGLETLHVSREAEDVSWWNPLEPAEMESAYRANRAEARRRLDEPDLLKGATERLLRRMRDGLEDLGLTVRVEMLPPPPA